MDGDVHLELFIFALHMLPHIVCHSVKMFRRSKGTTRTLKQFTHWFYGHSILTVEHSVKSLIDLENHRLNLADSAKSVDHAVNYKHQYFPNPKVASSPRIIRFHDGTFHENGYTLRELKGYRPITMELSSITLEHFVRTPTYLKH
jgi:hypothetical protein